MNCTRFRVRFLKFSVNSYRHDTFLVNVMLHERTIVTKRMSPVFLVNAESTIVPIVLVATDGRDTQTRRLNLRSETIGCAFYTFFTALRRTFFSRILHFPRVPVKCVDVHIGLLRRNYCRYARLLQFNDIGGGNALGGGFQLFCQLIILRLERAKP